MSHKELCYYALTLLQKHADQKIKITALDRQVDLDDFSARLKQISTYDTPQVIGAPVKAFWKNFRETQLFQILTDDGLDIEVRGIDNLATELSVSGKSLRQRFSVGRGEFQMHGRHKHAGRFLTVIRCQSFGRKR